MAIDFMTANLDQAPSLSEIAQEAKVSVSHLSSLFRAETRLSPGRYLMILRMQKAAELLTGSVLSVKEVMAKVGFNDKSDFVRSFRKTHGTTPSAYRERSAKPTRRRHGS